MDTSERDAARRKLIQERLDLPDRMQRSNRLQESLRVWLLRRPELRIGAYWPIKGEFDPLPSLYRWAEASRKDSSTSTRLRVMGSTRQGPARNCRMLIIGRAEKLGRAEFGRDEQEQR